MDAGSLESLGAITGLVNDQQQKRSMAQAQLATLADQLSQSQNAQQGNSAFGGALLGSLGNGQPEAPAPGQSSVPGAQRAPAQAGGLSIPGFLNALKTSRFAGNGQAMAAALQKFLPLMQQQQQQTRLNQAQANEQDYRRAMLENAGARIGQGQQRIDNTKGGDFSPEAKQFWTEYFYKNGSLPPGLARTGSGSKLVQEIMGAVPGQGSPGGMIANKAELAGTTAGERTLGQRQAALGVATNEVKQFLPLATALSQKVDRSKYPDLNSILLAAEKGTGDPTVVQFAAANNAVMNAYSQIVTRGGTPTDASRSAAAELLSTAYSKGQYATVAQQIMAEANAALKAPAAVKQEMREGMTGNEPSTPSVQTDSPQPDAQSIVDELKKRGIVQ